MAIKLISVKKLPVYEAPKISLEEISRDTSTVLGFLTTAKEFGYTIDEITNYLKHKS